jgi:hypothetical protein
LIILVGYFVQNSTLEFVRSLFLQWSVVLFAVALLVGVMNLVVVHARRITSQERNRGYSLLLVVSFLATILVALLTGPTSQMSLLVFNSIQVPIESSLMAILSVILIYAAARMIRRRMNLYTVLFLATVLLVLVGTAPLPFVDVPILQDIRNWLARGLAVAGARGLLLGVALGTVATGLRVLMGADRPYGG